jgi:hypothetical protein
VASGQDANGVAGPLGVRAELSRLLGVSTLRRLAVVPTSIRRATVSAR